jgi:hypothetical protein
MAKATAGVMLLSFAGELDAVTRNIKPLTRICNLIEEIGLERNI